METKNRFYIGKEGTTEILPGYSYDLSTGEQISQADTSIIAKEAVTPTNKIRIYGNALSFSEAYILAWGYSNNYLGYSILPRNIANPADIFNGYVSSNGTITTGASYTNAKCIEIPVKAGKVISFGNYYLDNSDTAYYSFWTAKRGTTGASVVSSAGLPNNNQNIKKENITVPAGASYLYVTLRQNPSQAPVSAYAEFMCNYGSTLLDYMQPSSLLNIVYDVPEATKYIAFVFN